LSRQQATLGFRHCWVAKLPANDCVLSSQSREANQIFPLYFYPDSDRGIRQDKVWPRGKDGRAPNLDPKFVRDLEERLSLSFVSDGEGDLKKTFGPEDVFDYIYAVLHAPTYRTRYAEFLKRDFPRVPLTSKAELFRRLCGLGAKLVGLHLLESPLVAEHNLKTGFPEPSDDTVAKGHPKYVEPGMRAPETGEKLTTGRIYINQDQYFDGVEPEVWGFFVGGYQVCEKWLNDRRGRKLSWNDIVHYKKIVAALGETIRLMQEIDSAIGAWPME